MEQRGIVLPKRVTNKKRSMKNHTLKIILFAISTLNINAQVAIGKTSVQGSSILDFNEAGNTRGIILPAVTAMPADTVNGTLEFFRGDAIVYMRQNGVWVPMTEGNGSTSTLIINTSPETGNGVVIGAATSSAPGVLVLESSTLSLTLPKVINPHINIKSPYPGTMCYDTASNTIAVFDGTYWNFWK